MISDANRDAYCDKIEQRLKHAKTKQALYTETVNAPFCDKLIALDYDLGVVVLLLVNPDTQMIDRIALSDTYSAEGAVRMSAKPFHEIKIPLGHPENLIAQAINQRTPQQTSDWKYLFVPALTPKEARFNQAGAGIEASVIYPLDLIRGGAIIFSLYQPLSSLEDKHHVFMARFAKMAASYLAKLSVE